MVKMILTDLDGTLLRDDKTLSKYTYDIVNQVRARGIKFIPATARALRVLESMNLVDAIPRDGLICINGGHVYVGDELIHQQGSNPKETRDTVNALLHHFPQERISVEINNCFYVNHPIWEVDPNETQYQLSDLMDLPQDIATRIIIGLPSLEAYPLLQACLPDTMYTHTIEGRPLCRVLHKSVTKAKAIEVLCNRWKIYPEEVVCFGDDLNDIEMFDYCKTSVAVANACDAVKKRATHHTYSNNDDGVAKWIETNILDCMT